MRLILKEISDIIFSIAIMRPKVPENDGDAAHSSSTPDIYSTPILSERPSSTNSRSIQHADSLHQIVLTNKKPISSIPSDLQLQSHGNNDNFSFEKTVPQMLRNYPYGSKYLLPVMYRAALSRNYSHMRPAASIAPFLRLGKVKSRIFRILVVLLFQNSYQFPV